MGFCGKHCPSSSSPDLSGVAVVAAGLAGAAAVVWWLVTYAVVLAVGAAGVVVAVVALQVVLRRHMVLCLPVRAAVAAPIRVPAVTAARAAMAIEARPSRVLEGVVVAEWQEVRR